MNYQGKKTENREKFFKLLGLFMTSLLVWIVIIITLLLLTECTAHLYVHEEVICDTLEIKVIDTLIQWEPAIHIDTNKFYGDTLRRVWVQMEGGEWKQFIQKQ